MLLKNERDTQLFARKLVKFSKGSNIVICLNGNLGSGKTTFSRYFIQEYLKEAKIKEIPSPTFTLLQVYDCLLYTSPSPRDGRISRMPSSA